MSDARKQSTRMKLSQPKRGILISLLALACVSQTAPARAGDPESRDATQPSVPKRGSMDDVEDEFEIDVSSKTKGADATLDPEAKAALEASVKLLDLDIQRFTDAAIELRWKEEDQHWLHGLLDDYRMIRRGELAQAPIRSPASFEKFGLELLELPSVGPDDELGDRPEMREAMYRYLAEEELVELIVAYSPDRLSKMLSAVGTDKAAVEAVVKQINSSHEQFLAELSKLLKNPQPMSIGSRVAYLSLKRDAARAVNATFHKEFAPEPVKQLRKGVISATIVAGGWQLIYAEQCTLRSSGDVGPPEALARSTDWSAYTVPSDGEYELRMVGQELPVATQTMKRGDALRFHFDGKVGVAYAVAGKEMILLEGDKVHYWIRH